MRIFFARRKKRGSGGSNTFARRRARVEAAGAAELGAVGARAARQLPAERPFIANHVHAANPRPMLDDDSPRAATEPPFSVRYGATHA